MEPQCEIKFTTTRSKTDLNADKTCYQGKSQWTLARRRGEDSRRPARDKSSLKNNYYSDCSIDRGGGVSPPQRRKDISLFCEAETAPPLVFIVS